MSLQQVENVSEKLEEFRSAIKENNVETRTDDEFLERFLKLRRYDVQKSLTKLQSYENFKSKDDKAFITIKRSTLKTAIQTKAIDLLEDDESAYRKVIWVKAGLWDPSLLSADELIQLTGLMADVTLAANKSSDVIVAKIIFDMNEFGMKHINALSTKFAKKMIHFLGECLPAVIHSIYIIREPKVFSIIYNLFKPFLDEKTKKHMKFLGQDLVGLQEFIKPHVLPVELGGTNQDVNLEKWMSLLETPEVAEDLKKSGYKFVD